MTLWLPAALSPEGTRHRALVRLLVEGIESGRLRPGERLPSHRDLAQRLGLSIGSVTRAYGEVRRLGLVAGEVGRGSFVRHRRRPAGTDYEHPAEPVIDLYQDLPPTIEAERTLWRSTLADLARGTEFPAAARRGWSLGSRTAQTAGVNWIARLGLAAEPARVLDAPSSRAGLTAALLATTRRGETLLAAELGHPGLRGLAHSLGLELQTVESDDQGPVPAAVESIARKSGAVTLVLQPTLASPTNTTLPSTRRRALARVAARHPLWIIEQEAAAFLMERAPRPVAGFAPERTLLLASLHLALSPGLHTTYCLVPEAIEPSFRESLTNLAGFTTGLVTAIAERWTRPETADRLVRALRDEVANRSRAARRRLSRWEPCGHAAGTCLWLGLPRPWRAEEFTARAKEHGIAVLPGEWFALGPGAVPQGVRIGLGGPETRTELDAALSELDRILERGA